MNNKIFKFFLASLLVLTITACEKEQEGQAPAPGRPIAKVTTVTIEPLSVILYSDMPGRTLASEKAEVRPEVTGIMRERTYTEGAYVEKGDQLYTIDPDLYQAAYDSAKANLEKAKAALSVTELRERRTAELRRQNSVSQQDYDETRAAYLQSKAEVEAATAAVQSAKINLDRTKIQAPISGLTSTSTVTVGTLVATNQVEPLTTIYQIDPMNVDLTQSVQELISIGNSSSRLKENINYKKLYDLNLPVVLITNDGKQYGHIGRLKFIDVGVDSSTATMTMRAEFPNPEYKLMPGLFVRAKLQVGVDENAILIPQRAVLRDTKGAPYIFVAEGYDSSNKPKEGEEPPKAKAVRRFITLGATYGTNWQVLDGLKAGESIIFDGLQNVTEQAEVAIVKQVPLDLPSDADYLAKNNTFVDFAEELASEPKNMEQTQESDEKSETSEKSEGN